MVYGINLQIRRYLVPLLLYKTTDKKASIPILTKEVRGIHSNHENNAEKGTTITLNIRNKTIYLYATLVKTLLL